MSVPPALFDRALRRTRRDRAAQGGANDLEQLIADELSERLQDVQRAFPTALVINTGHGTVARLLRAQGMAVTETDHGPAFAQAAKAVLCDEDQLPRTLGPFDLVVAAGGFDTIDDLPGALIAARLSLKPGGLFFACMIGAPSLATLRRMTSEADAETGRAVARLHPQVDVRAAGDLLVRAGFALPVADSISFDVSYASLDRMLADLRSFGASNVLADRHPARRSDYIRLQQVFAKAAGPDGRVNETITLIAMTGWSPEA